MNSVNRQYKSHKIKGTVIDYMQNVRNDIPNNADRRLLREQLIPVIIHIEKCNLNYYPDFSEILKQHDFTSINIRDLILLYFERLNTNIIFPGDRQIKKSNDNEKSIMLIRLVLESAEEFLNSIIIFIQNNQTKVKKTQDLLNDINSEIKRMYQSTFVPQQNNNNIYNFNNILNYNSMINHNISNNGNSINSNTSHNNDTNSNSINNNDPNSNCSNNGDNNNIDDSMLNNINLNENNYNSNDNNDDNNNKYNPIPNIESENTENTENTENKQSKNNEISNADEEAVSDNLSVQDIIDDPSWDITAGGGILSWGMMSDSDM